MKNTYINLQKCIKYEMEFCIIIYYRQIWPFITPNKVFLLKCRVLQFSNICLAWQINFINWTIMFAGYMLFTKHCVFCTATVLLPQYTSLIRYMAIIYSGPGPCFIVIATTLSIESKLCRYNIYGWLSFKMLGLCD